MSKSDNDATATDKALEIGAYAVGAHDDRALAFFKNIDGADSFLRWLEANDYAVVSAELGVDMRGIEIAWRLT